MPNPSVAAIGTYASASDVANCGVPSGVVNGSLVYLIGMNQGSTTLTPPAGFTTVFSQVTSAPYIRVWRKRATGSESGTYAVTGAIFNGMAGVALRIADDDGTASPDGQTDAENNSTTTTPATNLASADTNALLLWVDGTNDTTCTVPSGYTRQTAAVSQKLHVAAKTHPATGTTGDVTGTIGVAQANTAALFAVKSSASDLNSAFLAIL